MYGNNTLPPADTCRQQELDPDCYKYHNMGVSVDID